MAGANILAGTTVSWNAVALTRVYSIDGPDLAVDQVDTTTLASTTSQTTSPVGSTGDVVAEFTNGINRPGPITVEADFDDGITLAASGDLVITFNNLKAWTIPCNLANMTVAPGSVPDAMRMNLIFQPIDLPGLATPT